jgi:hypothetical protein
MSKYCVGDKMGSFRNVGATCFMVSAVGAGSAWGAELATPAFQGEVRPITEPFRIEVKPGWHARCVSRTGGADITIIKTTIDDKGTVLNALVSNSPLSVSAVGVYGVQLYFTGSGSPGDVQIAEVDGHPIDDEAYLTLQNAATSIVPEAEFAGRMSDEIDTNSVGPSSAQAGVDVALRLAVEGTGTDKGEDYVIIHRDGLMRGVMEGQHITIRFAGYTQLHRESGLISEQILNTELRSDSASPVRENSRLSCEITRSS